MCVAAKSLSEPVDSVHQVKSKGKKSGRPADGKLNLESKLELKAKEVPFHGHLLTTEGLKPDPEKVRAIVEMPRPEGRDDILRLNGMVNYLSRFLPNLSDVMKPLRDLTHKDGKKD